MVNILWGMSGLATLWAIYDSGGVVLLLVLIPVVLMALLAIKMGCYK